jgi:uncharacterized protein (DUF2336 family)
MSDNAKYQSYLLIDELEQTLSSGSAQDCGRMAARVADLFEAGSERYSETQIALFDEVLLRLSNEIELKARAKLAQRLAYMDNAPPKLIRSFAADDAIDVARPVLTYSPRLTDSDLTATAASKGQAHLYAIGRRAQLSEAVTEVLVERGDDRVVRALSRNPGARLSPASYGKLTSRALSDSVLAFGIARRDDIPRQCFIRLIEAASANVRELLEAANPGASAAIRDAVDEVAVVLREQAPSPTRTEHFDRTVAALAKLGPFPAETVEQALLDDGADMVLVLARAARAPWVTAKELLLTFTAKRALSPFDLARASASFERLTPDTARRIVEFRARRTTDNVAALHSDPPSPKQG